MPPRSAQHRPVLLTFKKWPDTFHWSVETWLVGHDDLGLWLGTVRGARIHGPNGERARASADSVTLCSPGRSWMPRWYAQRTDEGRASRFSCYVDMITPPAVTGESIDVVDLDLDVAKTWDGEVVVLDEDEFAERTYSLSYPPAVVDAATDACRVVERLLVRDAPPFAGEHQAVAAQWFAECQSSRSPG